MEPRKPKLPLYKDIKGHTTEKIIKLYPDLGLLNVQPFQEQ